MSVDNARFWSMFAVVAIHSTRALAEAGNREYHLIHVLHTPWKFASFGFFLASGFLTGRYLDGPRPLKYLQRRFSKVGGPWIFWLVIMNVALFSRDLLYHRLSTTVDRHFLSILASNGVYCLFHTAFWFVPNLLLSLSIVLLFRRFHDSLRFGGVLLACSLFYAANLYGAWLPAWHSEAVLGFVFYFWLGTYAFSHREALRRWVAHISFLWLWIACALAGMLAYAETVVLDRMGAADPLNTLRLSNQAFSLLAVLTLYKAEFAVFPRFMNVRRHTFGIYLTHSVVLLAFSPCLRSHALAPAVALLTATTMGSVALWIAVTLAAYGLSLLLTVFLASQRPLQWMVGVEAPGRPATGGVEIAGAAARA